MAERPAQRSTRFTEIRDPHEMYICNVQHFITKNFYSLDSCQSHITFLLNRMSKNSTLIAMTFLWCTLMNCITLQLLCRCSNIVLWRKKRKKISFHIKNWEIFLLFLYAILICLTALDSYKTLNWNVLKYLLIILYRKQAKIE